MDTGEIVIGVGGLAFSCLSLIAGYQIARRSGQMDKHDMLLGVWGGPPLSTGFLCVVLLGDSAEPSERRLTWLRIGLANRGRREATNVELTITCGRLGSFGDAPVNIKTIGPQLDSLATARSVRVDEGSTYIAHTIKAVRPGVGIDVLEPIPIQLGVRKGSTNVTSEDGVPVEIHYEIALSIPMRVVAVFTDREPLTAEFSMVGVRASTFDAAAKYAAEHYREHTEYLLLRPEWKNQEGILVGEIVERSVVRRI